MKHKYLNLADRLEKVYGWVPTISSEDELSNIEAITHEIAHVLTCDGELDDYIWSENEVNELICEAFRHDKELMDKNEFLTSAITRDVLRHINGINEELEEEVIFRNLRMNLQTYGSPIYQNHSDIRKEYKKYFSQTKEYVNKIIEYYDKACQNE